MKKKYLSLLLAPVLAAGFLAGCGDSNNEDAADQTDGTEVVETETPAEVPVDRAYDGEIPDVKGEWGKSVEVKPVGVDAPSVIVAETLIEGDGRVVGENDIVAAHYHGTLWDGKVFDSTFERAGEDKTSEPLVFSLNQVIQGWKYGLAGQKVGDRVELVIPSEFGYGEAGAGDIIKGGDTLVFVVDVVAASDPADASVLKDAKQTSNKPPAGLAIDGQLGAKPTISFDHDAKAPKDTEVVVLAEGNGREVTQTDAVVYHVTAAMWGRGDQANSTWDHGAAEYSQRAVGDSPGFAGMKVGSRVLLIQPNTQNPEAARVYVVDIVDALDLKPVE